MVKIKSYTNEKQYIGIQKLQNQRTCSHGGLINEIFSNRSVDLEQWNWERTSDKDSWICKWNEAIHL